MFTKQQESAEEGSGGADKLKHSLICFNLHNAMNKNFAKLKASIKEMQLFLKRGYGMAFQYYAQLANVTEKD